MRIRMLTTSAGPDGTVNAGQIVEVDDAAGQTMINGGFAEAAAAIPAVAVADAEPEDESAMLAGGPETADEKPRKGKAKPVAGE